MRTAQVQHGWRLRRSRGQDLAHFPALFWSAPPQTTRAASIPHRRDSAQALNKRGSSTFTTMDQKLMQVVAGALSQVYACHIGPPLPPLPPLRILCLLALGCSFDPVMAHPLGRQALWSYELRQMAGREKQKTKSLFQGVKSVFSSADVRTLATETIHRMRCVPFAPNAPSP